MRQEGGSFDTFHMTLLKMRHEQGRELSDPKAVLEAAEAAGFDLDTFGKDLTNSTLKSRIGRDYEEGVSEYGAFGVPTLVFDNGEAVFFKIDPVPEREMAADLLESLLHIVKNHIWVKEIKKPTPAVK